MEIQFSNPSRSYNLTRHAVRFWGHDRSIEASFFTTEDALRRLEPADTINESGFLKIFDAHLARIHEVAAKVYRRGTKGSYELLAQDF